MDIWMDMENSMHNITQILLYVLYLMMNQL